MRLKTNYKYIITILCITIIFFVIFSSVMYCALATTMTIDGSAYARIQSDVRITDFKIKDSSSEVVSSYEEFGRNTISSNVVLPSSDSYITYEIEVTNYGEEEVGILDITGLDSSLTYELSDYTLKDEICNDDGDCVLGIRKTFYLTIKPITFDASNTLHSIVLSFDFRGYYNIAYKNIDFTDMPVKVLDGDNIEIDFGDDAPSGVAVSMGNAQIDYYYVDGVLLVNDVSGDIIISNTSSYDLSGNGNTAIFANTIITDEGIVFDGKSSSARLPDDIGVSFPATYSLKFKTNSKSNQIIFGDRTTSAGFGTFSTNQQFVCTVGGTDIAARSFYFTTTVGVFYSVDILYESIQNIRLFVDGVEVTERGTLNRWDWTSNESYIGRRGYSASYGTSYFNGVIEKFMIYDDLLTEEEIQHNLSVEDPNDVINDNLKLYYYFK